MARTGKKVERKKKDKKNVPKRQATKARRGVKRKASSEPVLSKRRRHYNLRRSDSVEFVSETPCCDDVETQKKLAHLCLDSALYCRSCPARRKQSHISIITISSSDNEESLVRTAEWVAAVAQEQQQPNLSETENRTACKGDDIQEQMSLIQISTSPDGNLNRDTNLERNQNSQEQRQFFNSITDNNTMSQSLLNVTKGMSTSMQSLNFQNQHHQNNNIFQNPRSPHTILTEFTTQPQGSLDVVHDNCFYFGNVRPQDKHVSVFSTPLEESNELNHENILTSPNDSLTAGSEKFYDCTGSYTNSQTEEIEKSLTSQNHDEDNSFANSIMFDSPKDDDSV